MITPEKVKLFIGMLSSNVELFNTVQSELIPCFGSIDLKSPVWTWNYTSYYEKELGKNILRQFIFFESLIYPSELSTIKNKTVLIEKKFADQNGNRTINLDPGYLTRAKVVLASTKDFSHRIYLQDGIYGEVTLSYIKGNYLIYPYTYPDYSSNEYLDLFKKARQLINHN